MIFNEFSYFFAFLLPTVVAFHLAPRPARPWVVTAGGAGFFLFYGALYFGGCWGAVAILIFVLELLTTRLYRRGSGWCVYGIVQAVVILAAFKYLVFLTDAWNGLAGAAHLPALHGTGRLILPLGISFFTFEFIHYAADSYKGIIRGSTVGQYASFIFFFPTMVAGPIKRYQEFVPPLARARWEPRLAMAGITRILTGLVKKNVFSAWFAWYADRLNTPDLFAASRVTILGWVLAYGMKIYLDFSGYSDIAIGSGNLFGVAIPENFNWPYFSKTIAEFWRRWHISLGRWIFDYIYAPLGGSRDGAWRTALNLLITFAISGLWHGAAWNFVAWGLWHGVMMVTERWWRTRSPWHLPAPAAVALTFAGVNLGWVLFCMDLHRAGYVLLRLAGWR